MSYLSVLVLTFIAVPLVEIALFINVGGRIGLTSTLAIVVATAFVGAALVSRQGRGIMEDVRSEFSAGRFPGAQMAHGAMILVSGALLVTPGFLTDGVGFLLLVPPVREGLRRWWLRRYTTTVGL